MPISVRHVIIISVQMSVPSVEHVFQDMRLSVLNAVVQEEVSYVQYVIHLMISPSVNNVAQP